MFVGDPERFAIETGISSLVERRSQLAVGWFVVHLAGQTFGIRRPDATLLAIPYDTVRGALEQRGMHEAPAIRFLGAAEIASEYLDVIYRSGGASLFGLPIERFRTSIVWDGVDEAFDDGSHLLHFDQADGVRVIAFKNPPEGKPLRDLAEANLPSSEFYGVLDRWCRWFAIEVGRL